MSSLHYSTRVGGVADKVMTQYTSKVTVSGCFTLPGQLLPATRRCHAPCMLHAAAAAGRPGMMPASSIATACQYSCVLYSTVQYDIRQYEYLGTILDLVAAARSPSQRVLLLLLRCASRWPAARLGIRSYSRTALLKSHRRAFTTTHYMVTVYTGD
jgi:hypothetical protein